MEHQPQEHQSPREDDDAEERRENLVHPDAGNQDAVAWIGRIDNRPRNGARWELPDELSWAVPAGLPHPTHDDARAFVVVPIQVVAVHDLRPGPFGAADDASFDNGHLASGVRPRGCVLTLGQGRHHRACGRLEQFDALGRNAWRGLGRGLRIPVQGFLREIVD